MKYSSMEIDIVCLFHAGDFWSGGHPSLPFTFSHSPRRPASVWVENSGNFRKCFSWKEVVISYLSWERFEFLENIWKFLPPLISLSLFLVYKINRPLIGVGPIIGICVWIENESPQKRGATKTGSDNEHWPAIKQPNKTMAPGNMDFPIFLRFVVSSFLN